MILGMTNFTFAHVVLSLIGILSGFVVLYALLTVNRMAGWTLIFLRHDDSDERDGLRLSLPRLPAGDRCRHPVDDRAGGRHGRPLRLSSQRSSPFNS